ncbi:hypothetical protein [Fodinibius halophilus]|uniref:Uncharacterized protein n=1 Tax=Fodinibius halophilus TaxID=1736908 RepID=A0A6M1TBZ8_9BACT|nr:hypothetical protein [Fodinibius halophilus]NGP89883.1 hypothetical protein [Fodinibius halophilus]
MGQLADNKQKQLVNKLIPLLHKLNFANIWVKKHPEYPNPPSSKYIVDDYNPNLVAEKDGTDYYFEFINEYDLNETISNTALQKMVEASNSKWDVTIVIAIEYGRTEEINKLYSHFNISPSQVWEL